MGSSPAGGGRARGSGVFSPPSSSIAVTAHLERRGLGIAVHETRNGEFDQELAESRKRKLRMEEDQYFQAIVAADQALAANDPAKAERLLKRVRLGCGTGSGATSNRRLHPELLTIQGHSGFVCPDFRPDTTSCGMSCRRLERPDLGRRERSESAPDARPRRHRLRRGPRSRRDSAWPRPAPTARSKSGT